MKKTISLLLLLMFVLTGCSYSEFSIDDYKWELSRITETETGKILYCTAENKSSYEGAEIIDLSIAADNDKITITDNASAEAWNFSYADNKEVKPSSADNYIYDITYNSESGTLKGYATIGIIDKSSANDNLYLILTIGGYSIYLNNPSSNNIAVE